MRPAAPQATGRKMCIRLSLARLDSLALMTIDADATAKGIAERRATCKWQASLNSQSLLQPFLGNICIKQWALRTTGGEMTRAKEIPATQLQHCMTDHIMQGTNAAFSLAGAPKGTVYLE